MMQKQLQALPLICDGFFSICIVKFLGRKLIIIVLLQLLLSPFIITDGNINESNINNGNTVNSSLNPYDSSIIVHETNLTLKTTSKNDDDDDYMENGMHLSENNVDGNLILHQGEAQEQQSNGNLSSIGSTSALNQFQKINRNSVEQQQHDGEILNGKVLSRKRRYLIFPPGSSMQIGNIHVLPSGLEKKILFNLFVSLKRNSFIDNKQKTIQFTIHIIRFLATVTI